MNEKNERTFLELYSVQRSAVADIVQSVAVYTARFDRVDAKCRAVYEYMCAAMRERGIAIQDNPPVWAWAEPKEKIPRLARELLGDAEWQRGISVVRLRVPKACALLSSYFCWNEMLHDSLEHGTVRPAKELFMLDNLSEDDYVQAALPCIQASWVVETYQINRAG